MFRKRKLNLYVVALQGEKDKKGASGDSDKAAAATDAVSQGRKISKNSDLRARFVMVGLCSLM